jgi:hypothetical protein
LAGEIVAIDDHWAISNWSPDRTYVVDNPEGAGAHVKVTPRRVGMPVPFQFARVEIPVADGTTGLFGIRQPARLREPGRSQRPLRR